MAWLTTFPRRITRACLEMLPRLQAADSLRTVKAVAAGTGHLPVDVLRGYLAGLAQVSDAQSQAQPAKSSQAKFREQLAARGISFRVVQ